MQRTRGAPLSGATDTGSEQRGRRRAGVLVAVAAVVLLVDQITKVIALDRLADGRVVQVVGGILQLRLVRNPGVAFGVGADFTVVLTLLMLAVIVVILTMSRRLVSVPWAVGLGGMLGGAVGNLTDRLLREPGPLRGHVVDFLELPNWPVFNVADSAIVGGAVLVVVLSLRGIAHDGRESRARQHSGGDT
jgi:signal peptidase II